MENQPVPQASPAAAGPTIPQAWPGAFGIYKTSRDVVRFNAGAILLPLLFAFILNGLESSVSKNLSSGVSSLASLIVSILGVWLGGASTVGIISAIRQKKISFGDALTRSTSMFWKYLGLSLLTVLIGMVSILALVIPFFIVVPRLVLAPYFLFDQNLGPVQALKASWNATSGNVSKVWGIIGATIAMAFLILVLVGIYFLIMYSAAYAVLYAFILNQKAAAPQPTSAAASSPLAGPAA